MANTVLQGLVYKICDIYIDDIIIYGTIEEEFLRNFETVLQRLKAYNVTLNPTKAEIGLSQIEYVGHTVDGNGITISEERRKHVLDVPLPKTAKDLKSFLGLVSYYRDHLQDHSTIVQPLYQCITPYIPRNKVKWTKELERLFYQVQESVNKAPPLYFIDYNAPVYLHTDASDFGIGAHLFQLKDGKELPIAFLSKALNPTEIKWSVTEKECYAIFFALVKYEYLLRDIKFTLRTDHRNLTFLNESFQQKVKRWKIAIMHFNFDIEHIPGKDNVVADALSRLIKIPKLYQAESEDYDYENKQKESLYVITVNEDILRDVSYFRLEDDVYAKLATVHNSIIGHLGVERMIAKLKANGMSWRKMRMDCKKFIFQCAACQKMSAIYVSDTYSSFYQSIILSYGSSRN